MDNSKNKKGKFGRKFTESLKKIFLNEKKEKSKDKGGESDVRK